MKKLFLVYITFPIFFTSKQIVNNRYNDSDKLSFFVRDSINSKVFFNTFDSLNAIILRNGKFLDAVNLIESPFYNKSVAYRLEDKLLLLKFCAINRAKQKIKEKYYQIDSANYFLNKGIFTVLNDTSILKINQQDYKFLPFRFNFSDPLGKQDITNTFVTKLLATHQGNCRSLTYLYKILADELGAKCWIALAPGHMYIKNYSEKIGWYNTELTSGTFPSDAWIMTTSYIKPEAVKSGLYMDTLSNQQAIALCVLDLANLYERETHNYYDGFIVKCCDLVLKYHPLNPMALLTKAETLKKVLIREKSSKFPKPTYLAKEMEATYLKLFDLGYREMPPKMKAQKQQEEKENAKKYGSKK